MLVLLFVRAFIVKASARTLQFLLTYGILIRYGIDFQLTNVYQNLAQNAKKLQNSLTLAYAFAEKLEQMQSKGI